VEDVSRDLSDPGPVEVPVEALTANLSNGEEVASFKKDQSLVMQAHSNLNVEQDPTGGAAIDAAERLMREAHDGEQAHNERIDRFFELRAERRTADDPGRREQLGIEMERTVNNLEVEKLGNQQILDVLLNRSNTPNALYKKVAEHIIGKERRGEIGRIDEVDRPELVRQLLEEADLTTAADRILALAPTTPAIHRLPKVKDFMESTLRNYLVERTMKPTMEHSFKSILAPYDPHLRHRVRTTDEGLDLDVTKQEPGSELERDEVLLHSGLKDKEIAWGPEGNKQSVPFGEAWREFQEAGGWREGDAGAPDWMQRRMELGGIRVPSDSMSGLRTLKVIGFVDRPGTEAVVHPIAMEYLGGADLDIDKM